jgi:hypothetical protein
MLGETLGSYRIVSRLGAGGMGEVYLAQHIRIDRRAAIKVLLPGLSANQEMVDRFFSEARATSTIRHHGIVEVLDCDVHPSGRAYIVMELLEGESLAARLAAQRDFGRDLGRVLAVAAAIADAVGAAHAKGIVHRDLKPDNVFLVGDPSAPHGFAVKILDFGIAKLLGREPDGGQPVSARTRTGSLMGTPAYMSPEQCRGASRVDHRTDIYSLGCIVYEMLSGRLPFVYQGFGELISAHLTEAPPTFASLGVAVPTGVESWVRRLLAKTPDERFGQMTDVVASIKVLEQTPGPLPPAVRGALPAPSTTWPLTPVPSSTTFTAQAAEHLGLVAPRRRGLGPLAFAAIALAAGGAVWLGVGRDAGPPAIPAAPAALPSPAPKPRATVTVSIGDAPESLDVLVDGAPGTLPVRLPAGAEIHELTFRAPGFKERVVRVDGSTSRLLTLEMQPEPPAAPVTTPAASRSDAHRRRVRTSREAAPSEAELNEDARKL